MQRHPGKGHTLHHPLSLSSKGLHAKPHASNVAFSAPLMWAWCSGCWENCCSLLAPWVSVTQVLPWVRPCGHAVVTVWTPATPCLVPGGGAKEVETGKECLNIFIGWVVLYCRGSRGSQKFNYCSDAKRLHTVLARLDLTGGLHEVRQIAFVALSNTSRQRLFYVKEETLWLNCSLGIFRAVPVLSKFHTFHLQDMQ